MDAKLQQKKFIQFLVVDTAVMFVAVAFAVAHFQFGVAWALYGFIAFVAAAFAVQGWFVMSLRKKGGQ